MDHYLAGCIAMLALYVLVYAIVKIVERSDSNL
jgi:hypothetical protein